MTAEKQLISAIVFLAMVVLYTLVLTKTLPKQQEQRTAGALDGRAC